MIKTPEQELKTRTRRDFAILGAGAVAAIAGWEWISKAAEDQGLARPLRKVLDFNKRVTSAALYSDGHLAREFPLDRIGKLRPNGDVGLDDDLDAAAWKFIMTPYGGAGSKSTEFKLDDIYSLPKVEHTTEFKCIEGWSTVVHWAGARFSDFTARYAPGSERAAYVGLETPDAAYFVGLDMASALHPQTLLCYERNGKPLEEDHGAPLRLVTPVKYGIKQIKRIGKIRYSDEKPKDYWAQEGYDYYAGL